MPDVPFAARVAILLALMIVGAYVDVRRNGAAATRPREYGLILVGGAIGALFALGCDAVTSRLSPDYFVVGKGIDEGPGFWRGVLELALQAGSFGGVVVMGALLVATQPSATRRALAPREAIALGLVPVEGALLLAPLGGWLARTYDPLGLAREMRGVLEGEASWRFVMVWGIHAGLYTGALVGLVIAIVLARRSTRVPSRGSAGGQEATPSAPSAPG